MRSTCPEKSINLPKGKLRKHTLNQLHPPENKLDSLPTNSVITCADIRQSCKEHAYSRISTGTYMQVCRNSACMLGKLSRKLKLTLKPPLSSTTCPCRSPTNGFAPTPTTTMSAGTTEPSSSLTALTCSKAILQIAM